MIQNPLIRLPPEAVLDKLAAWAYEEFNSWWPHGGGNDLCEWVPCAYLDRDDNKVADADDMSTDEAEEQGLHIDFDPGWPGEEIATEEIRGKDKWGKWRTANVVLRVENEPSLGDYWGFTTHDKGADTITIVINWAREGSGLSWLTFAHQQGYRETGVAHLRSLLAHEMTHWLDPGQAVVNQPPMPDEVMLPWDRRDAERAYLFDVGERQALARETFERMKQEWDGRSYARMFPADLLAKVRRDWPHIDEWMGGLPTEVRRLVLADIGRAFYLWNRRMTRRRRLGRD